VSGAKLLRLKKIVPAFHANLRLDFMVHLMVQQLFLKAPTTLQEAIRVAYFLSVTSNRVAVTALSGSFGHSGEAEGPEGNSRAKAEQYMRGRSSAG
jgi:hypothetical protein